MMKKQVLVWAQRTRLFLRDWWVPTFVLVALPVYVIGRATTVHNYTRYVYYVERSAGNALSIIFFVLAALLALRPQARKAAVEHLDKLSRASAARHAFWLAAAYLGVVVWTGFLRYCQVRGYMMPEDTANSINGAYGFIRHGVLEYTPLGVKVLSLQPIVIMAVYSPILLLWNSPFALYALQHVLICSAPFAAYALTYVLTASSFAGFIALFLALFNSYFLSMLEANLSGAAMGAFVIWALYFLAAGRRAWAAACIALALCCGWQAPIVFFGLGIYLAWMRRDDKPSAWALPALICAASAALFLAEGALVKHYRSFNIGKDGLTQSNYWPIYFSHMVPPDTPGARIPFEMLTHPLRTASHFLQPLYYHHAALVLRSVGFLCVLAPAQMIPFVVTALPQVLSAGGQHGGWFMEFRMHHASPMYGPLLFAAAYGIRRAYLWLKPRAALGWLLAWALIVGGVMIRAEHGSVMPDWRPWYFDAMPRMMRKIPPNARLWADEYASTALANRRWIKSVSYSFGWAFGYADKVFKPDYVFLDVHWLTKSDAAFRAKVLTYLSMNRYEIIAQDSGLILWRLPVPSASPEEEPEWIHLPEPDAAAAQAVVESAMRYIALQDKREETAEKIRQYKDDLIINPKSAQTHYSLGVLMASRGEEEEAVAHYREALRAEPDHSQSQTNLGAIAFARGRWKEALVRFDMALRSDSGNLRARLNRGVLLREAGRVDEAILNDSETVAQHPDSAEARNNLGAALAARGRLEEAVARYHEALRLQTDYSDAYTNLGNARAAQNRPDEALAAYRKALALRPADITALYNQGVLLARLGRLEEAARPMRTILSLDPGNARARDLLMRIGAK